MESPTAKLLRIGTWAVNPASGQISRGSEIARLEVRALRLLLCLADHAGEVVSIDDLLNQVWSGVIVSPDSVYQAVASLRRQLGDDSKQPIYIETVPRLGYRMVATVSPGPDESLGQTGGQAGGPPGSSPPSDGEPQPRGTELPVASPAPAESSAAGDALATTGTRPLADMSTPAPGSRIRAALTRVAGVALGLGLAGAFLFYGRAANNNHSTSQAAPSVVAPLPQKSIGVLPFLDLTSESMDQEYFADGMTEELIDKLSKIPGVRVPGPTSSFYFKGKKIPVADIAKSMGVAYLLDGSIRKSGGRLRVAARLIRADSGYVVWTETYDRPLGDVLKVQDDIAGEVTKAVAVSIEAPGPPTSRQE